MRIRDRVLEHAAYSDLARGVGTYRRVKPGLLNVQAFPPGDCRKFGRTLFIMEIQQVMQGLQLKTGITGDADGFRVFIGRLCDVKQLWGVRKSDMRSRGIYGEHIGRQAHETGKGRVVFGLVY